MNYELIIPDSIWRDEELRPHINKDLALPALACLNGKGRRFSIPSTDLASVCAQRMGLIAPAVAPLTLQIDHPTAEHGFWLRADPVHLRIDRDRLTVLGVPFFQISQAEADALVAALNRLFAEDGFTFVAATPTRWYLKLPVDPQLSFTPFEQALGGNMNDFLPQGEKALQFHAVLNEIQMVLYGHSVNDERDEAGLPMINSVWLWGGGILASGQSKPAAAQPIYGGNEIVQAMAGSAWHVALTSASSLPSTTDAVVVLDALSFDAIYGNAYEWRTQWEQLENDWFSPLLSKLKAGQLEQLTLTFPAAGEQVKIKRSDLYRFWRPARLPF
ncbi:hypothetical protein K4H28_07050 [Deefgea tanakiae]|uniref:Phosphoglycerate mutase n=1 Tax=Deefgea tanakiae TaxID=2865840 RepID=A0ABX8Z9B0_9NEIS|nr:hypothetical protein [Deefgea tanakiae]QZA79146.1 hypothetical protein K4H28_07050 [Deefgea tanakiae]